MNSTPNLEDDFPTLDGSNSSLFENSFIFNKLIENNQSDPSFAFYSSIHFMSALQQICSSSNFQPKLDSIQSLSLLNKNDDIIFKSFCSYLMSLNFIQTLSSFKNNSDNSIHYLRESITCWYYSIYHSLISVIKVFGEDGKSPENHRGTLNVFNENIHKYYPEIINFAIKNLNNYETQIKDYMKKNNYIEHEIKYKPNGYNKSIGAYFSYYKGTCNHLQNKSNEIVKNKHKIKNFRSSENRELRDSSLINKTCGFYDLAFRFRIKAHYTDSMYMCLLEKSHNKIASKFITDCLNIAKYIAIINLKIIRKRLGKNISSFDTYFKDIQSHSNIDNNILDELYKK